MDKMDMGKNNPWICHLAATELKVESVGIWSNPPLSQYCSIFMEDIGWLMHSLHKIGQLEPPSEILGLPLWDI